MDISRGSKSSPGFPLEKTEDILFRRLLKKEETQTKSLMRHQTYADILEKGKCQAHELKNEGRISVALALKKFTFSAWIGGGALIAGWDETGGTLYDLNSSSRRMVDKNCSEKPFKKRICATGSGAKRVISYLEDKLDDEIPAIEAAKLAKSAICYAAYGAYECGNFVSVFLVNEDGWKTLIAGDVIEEWQEENIKMLRSDYDLPMQVYIGSLD